MSGMSFVCIEENLRRAFQLLCPGFKLPTRKDLAGNLLDKCYEGVKTKVDTHLARDELLCLVCDGWTNVKNDPIVNYTLVSPKVSLFLESNSTGEIQHTADFLAKD